MLGTPKPPDIVRDSQISIPPAMVLVPDGVSGLSTLTDAVNMYSSAGGTGVLCAMQGDDMTEDIRAKIRLAERMLLNSHGG